MTPVDAIDAMALMLSRPGGWCKRRHHQDDGAMCLLGALDVVTDAHLGLWGRVYAAVRNACGAEVATWNDRPETTLADVLAVLRRARAALEAKP